jgi:guanosine-3',5'-bis(diphosphate) 3'-pyrophosphohydrolase
MNKQWIFIVENKETFRVRLIPYFSPSDQLDIKLAYCLAKFGHRAQTRNEMSDGKPTRYFEHVRRVAIILMDEMKVMDRDMIIAALLHDSLEDTRDLTSELIEHSFGSRVTRIVKMLSKVPKEGYLDRLSGCHEWEILAIKACDRLDNLRSLMIPENTREFQKKQILETKVKYFPIFDRMVTLTPPAHHPGVSTIRDEIRRIAERCAVMIELQEEQENKH